jgi:hypothetical protein
MHARSSFSYPDEYLTVSFPDAVPDAVGEAFLAFLPENAEWSPESEALPG